MNCPNCGCEYAANHMTGYPGGYSAPGPVLVFASMLAAAGGFCWLTGIGAGLWLHFVLIGCSVVALGMTAVALGDCNLGGNRFPRCREPARVHPWSF